MSGKAGRCLLIVAGERGSANTYLSEADARRDKRDCPSLRGAVVVTVAEALAARALLKACKALVRDFGGITGGTNSLDEARAAIARAEGGAR